MSPIRLRHLPLTALVGAAVLGSARAAPPPDTFSIGSRSITVPPPAGFVRCDGIDAEWDKAMQAFHPGVNRVLAMFGTPEDLAALKAGSTPDYSRNCNIQVTRSIENQEIGERTFAGLREQMKSGILKMKSDLERQLQQVASDGSGRLNKEYGIDAVLSISDTAFLGFFEDSTSSLGFTMAMNVVKSAGAGEAKARVATAAIVSAVNGRMVNFYATLRYEAESDRTAAEKIVTGWRDAVVAANPRLAGPEAPGGWFSGTLRMAIIGGAIGALVVILKMAFTKKKSSASRANAPSPSPAAAPPSTDSDR